MIVEDLITARGDLCLAQWLESGENVRPAQTIERHLMVLFCVDFPTNGRNLAVDSTAVHPLL